MKVTIRCLKNKRIMVIYFITYVLLFSPSLTFSQDRNYAEIGKPVPEFTIRNVSYYKDKEIPIFSLKGQYTILDFWDTGCGVCIKSFPKMSAMQKRFADKLNIILIGKEEKNRDIAQFYEKFRLRDSLKLISAYDSVAFRKFVYLFVPHVIWIDKEGIIKAISSSSDVTTENIEKFINDEYFSFTDISYQAYITPKIDLSKPLLIDGNGGEDTAYIFRSLLSEWSPATGRGQWRGIDIGLQLTPDLYQITGASPIILYRTAYWGNYGRSENKNVHPNIIFNVSDSASFMESAYNYSVQFPKGKGNKQKVMASMQQDLRNAFGYDAQFRERMMPVLKLVVVDKAKTEKLNPSTSEVKFQWNDESKDNFFENLTITEILPGLGKRLLAKLNFGVHIEDETGITQKVSLKVKAFSDDYEGIRRELKKYGLDLVVAEKEFKVLEVSDL